MARHEQPCATPPPRGQDSRTNAGESAVGGGVREGECVFGHYGGVQYGPYHASVLVIPYSALRGSGLLLKMALCQLAVLTTF